MNESEAERAPELCNLTTERMRGVVHAGFKLPSHPLPLSLLLSSSIPPHHAQSGGSIGPSSPAPYSKADDTVGW